jgi:hypothetical protein
VRVPAVVSCGQCVGQCGAVAANAVALLLCQRCPPEDVVAGVRAQRGQLEDVLRRHGRDLRGTMHTPVGGWETAQRRRASKLPATGNSRQAGSQTRCRRDSFAVPLARRRARALRCRQPPAARLVPPTLV